VGSTVLGPLPGPPLGMGGGGFGGYLLC